MHFIPFNSRKEYHKFPYGAVAAGEKLVLRIILPRGEQCSAVRLKLFSDSEQESKYPFLWDGMQGDSEEWWRLDLAAPDKGVWWYSFEFDTPWGVKQISKTSCADGIIGGGERWQLTVYDPEYVTPDWLCGGIMYQIFPDRFRRSGKTDFSRPDESTVLRSDWGAEPMWEPDENGKIHRYDFFGGDLKGIEESLDYLSSLGVTCIYLNPIFKARSNHRYDTGDYMTIDPLLGDEQDFKSLCKSARAHKIRIILDGVFSHTGADSVYFDRFGNYGGSGAYCDKNSKYSSWYKFRTWPDDYESWWGVDILPELDETDPGVLGFLAGENGVARKWLRMGASGWRLDVADELPDKFLDSFAKAVRSEKEDGFIYGEVWEDATNKISYGKRRRYLLGGQLDSVMNYPFANAVIDFVKNKNAEGLNEIVESVAENYPPAALNTLMNHIGTHDTVRVLTLLGRKEPVHCGNGRDRGRLSAKEQRDGIRLLKLASLLQFTLPGVPCIYYGDEAGLSGGEDPFNRGCFPWGLENAELLGHYRALAAMRKSCTAFKTGRYVPVSAALGCIAFERVCKNERILIIANANDHEIDYDMHQSSSDAAVLFGKAPDGSRVHIEANSAAVLKFDR